MNFKPFENTNIIIISSVEEVKVEKNTALVIDNQGLDQVSVELYVIGDTGLSM